MTVEAEGIRSGLFPMPLEPAPPNIRRALLEQAPIQIPDVRLEPDYGADRAGLRSEMGFRSIMSVPLLHEGRSIGTIGVARREPGLFPESAVALLQTFARQAVIAIENVRLFNETQEALERQTATAEILRVISELADRRAAGVRRHRRDGSAAARVRSGAGAALRRADAVAGGLGNARWPAHRHGAADRARRPALNFPARAAASGQNYHVPDWNAVELPEQERGIQALFGVNSSLMLPLLRDGSCIGVLAFARKRAGAFDANEIALAETFARPGRDRDRERAPVQRDPGGTGPADGDVGRAARHQRIAHRRATGVRHHRRACRRVDRGALLPRDPLRRRVAAPGQPARRQRRRHGGAARRLAPAAGWQHLDRGARDSPARRGQRGGSAG